MNEQPKVYVIRPGELREQAMKWLAGVDDHLTAEDPAEGENPCGSLPGK